jgi:hypothetical protein
MSSEVTSVSAGVVLAFFAFGGIVGGLGSELVRVWGVVGGERR